MANWRVLLHVQRNGDIGSPRLSGSTRASKAVSSAGSRTLSLLRPPPGRRTRSGVGSAPPKSRSPCWMVGRDTPAARATRATPPWPNARASTARHSRRCRSFKYGSKRAQLLRQTAVRIHALMICSPHRRYDVPTLFPDGLLARSGERFLSRLSPTLPLAIVPGPTPKTFGRECRRKPWCRYWTDLPPDLGSWSH